MKYVTLDHKTSQGQNLSIFLNKLSVDVWFVRIGQYLKIWNLRMPNYTLRISTLKLYK